MERQNKRVIARHISTDIDIWLVTFATTLTDGEHRGDTQHHMVCTDTQLLISFTFEGPKLYTVM